MPYKDPEQQREHRRMWSAGKLHPGSGHVVKPRDTMPFEFARLNPGQWTYLRRLRNQNSAGVQAWRISHGLYGEGWDAKTVGAEVWIRWFDSKDTA